MLFTAVSDAIVMLLGGEPIGPRLIEWNFVSSSKDRLEQAKADWRAGPHEAARRRRPGVHSPPEPPPPANLMS